MTGRRVKFRYLSGKRIGSGANIELEALATWEFARVLGGANIGLEALVLWTREVQNVGATVEERGKRQNMLEDVRAKAGRRGCRVHVQRVRGAAGEVHGWNQQRRGGEARRDGGVIQLGADARGAAIGAGSSSGAAEWHRRV